MSTKNMLLTVAGIILAVVGIIILLYGAWIGYKGNYCRPYAQPVRSVAIQPVTPTAIASPSATPSNTATPTPTRKFVPWTPTPTPVQ